MENNKNLAKELLSLWAQFCVYVVETYPSYTDNDFNLDNFMSWLDESVNHTETPT